MANFNNHKFPETSIQSEINECYLPRFVGRLPVAAVADASVVPV